MLYNLQVNIEDPRHITNLIIVKQGEIFLYIYLYLNRLDYIVNQSAVSSIYRLYNVHKLH